LLAAFLASRGTHAAEIRGRIFDDRGKPLPHAIVRVVPEIRSTAVTQSRPKPAKTEDSSLGVLLGSVFRVRVDAHGYAPLTQPDIPADAVVQLHLRRGVSVSGVVCDRASKTPIAGATVLAWDKDAEAFGEAAFAKGKSGKDGRFVVPDLPSGPVSIEARASGRAPLKSRNVTVPKSGFVILLDPAGGLTGRVEDTAGDPVVGAQVRASWRDAAGARSRLATTDADGRYRIADVDTPAVDRVIVRAATFLPTQHEGPAPEDGVVDFVLEHGGSIVGVVRGHDGKTPPSFRVKIREKGDASRARGSTASSRSLPGISVSTSFRPESTRSRSPREAMRAKRNRISRSSRSGWRMQAP
jgi:hypothetical protein